MHALAPYLFRCYNPNAEKEQRYSSLSNIKEHDFLDIIDAFIRKYNSGYIIFEETKQVFRFNDITRDEKNREIYGWFESGYYGTKTDIINIETGDVDFEKTKTNAEIIKYYIHFYIPKGVNEGMAFLHTYRGDGIKTLFMKLFADYFKEVTSLVIQMNPLAYDKAIEKWMDAIAKEIKVTKFHGVKDVAEQARKLGHNEQELIIKPPRNSGLGKLRDYFTKNSEQSRLVEVLKGYGEVVKTVVELGDGRKRTFRIGTSVRGAVCEIIFDEEQVLFNDGMPEINSLNKMVDAIIIEYIQLLYRGVDIRRA
ncbi:hypothetical protein [Pectobacterium peruviense]|uniref:Uncharacterized protein n=1 Tax=Pectobacterium peruviense TaxID=2066479 RepID=A0ABX4S1K4_9GAMM|nr:hypothetical protein [Pectobacterium peruviense]KML69005.1 hypothetical protein G033_04215 [Pectobacterium peruviense]PKX83317.1 hypothetical protein A0G02_10610 [Pectobacterium peruviense]PKX84388.1 hypothetical protein A0G03_20480 [Pectobacterium peruviense]